LVDFSIDLPALSKIISSITINCSSKKRNNYEEINTLIAKVRAAKSGFYLKMDHEDDHNDRFLEFDKTVLFLKSIMPLKPLRLFN
jgi:hypothetical protein